MARTSLFHFGLLLLLATAHAAGCYDPNQPCGEELVLGTDGTCVCPEGTGPSDDGMDCIPQKVPDIFGPSDDFSDPPGEIGLGDPCVTEQDCLGFDADYCE